MELKMMEWIAGLLGAVAGALLYLLGKASQRQGHHLGEHRSKGRNREMSREARQQLQELSKFLNYDGSEREEPSDEEEWPSNEG